MNRNEAKAYALNELGLDRDTVRQFGNLSRTQTWLDAIAAQASGGIASREAAIVEDATSAGDAIAPREEMIVEDAIALAPSKVIVEDAVLVEDAIAAIPEPISQDPSFETFWDSPPALLQPQPLVNISAFDGDWNDPEPPAFQASEVIVYPLVIGLLMLWAMVQLLLLAGRGIAMGLTALANALDAAARHRLKAEPSRRHLHQGLRKTTLVLG